MPSLASRPAAGSGVDLGRHDAATATTRPDAHRFRRRRRRPRRARRRARRPPCSSFDGHGYGHGVGLSQWGAYGYALHGWTYDRILAHYYTGTTLGPAPVSKVRVLVAGGNRVTLGATAPWQVADARGNKIDARRAAPLTLRPCARDRRRAARPGR